MNKILKDIYTAIELGIEFGWHTANTSNPNQSRAEERHEIMNKVVEAVENCPENDIDEYVANLINNQ